MNTTNMRHYMRDYMQRRRAALKGQGKCINCGSTENKQANRNLCDPCLAKHAGRQVKYLVKRQSNE